MIMGGWIGKVWWVCGDGRIDDYIVIGIGELGEVKYRFW